MESATSVRPSCCFGHIFFRYTQPRSIKLTNDNLAFFAATLKSSEQTFIAGFFNTEVNQAENYLFRISVSEKYNNLLKEVYSPKSEKLHKFKIERSDCDRSYNKLKDSRCRANNKVYIIVEKVTREADKSYVSSELRRTSQASAGVSADTTADAENGFYKVYKCSVPLRAEYREIISLLTEDLNQVSRLQFGASNGQLTWIKQSLEYFSQRSIENPLLFDALYRRTALTIAVIYDQGEAVKQLYDKTAEQKRLETKTEDNKTKWFFNLAWAAAANASINALRVLKAKEGFVSVLKDTNHGKYPLMGKAAIHDGKFKELVEFLITECGLTADTADIKAKVRPISYVAEFGDDINQLRLLVERYHADINAIDGNGNTVLHLACASQKTHFIRYLLEKAPQCLDIENALHETPFAVRAECALMDKNYEKLKPFDAFIFDLIATKDLAIARRFIDAHFKKIPALNSCNIGGFATKIITHTIKQDKCNVFCRLLAEMLNVCVFNRKPSQASARNPGVNESENITNDNNQIKLCILAHCCSTACFFYSENIINYLIRHEQSKCFFIKKVMFYFEDDEYNHIESPAYSAATSPQSEKALRLLKRRGANFNIIFGKNGISVLMLAISLKCELEVIKNLVNIGEVELTATDLKDNNVLHYAFSYCGDKEQVERLTYLLNIQNMTQLLGHTNHSGLLPVHTMFFPINASMEFLKEHPDVFRKHVRKFDNHNIFIKRHFIDNYKHSLTDKSANGDEINRLIEYSDFISDICHAANDISDDSDERINIVFNNIKSKYADNFESFVILIERESPPSEISVKRTDVNSPFYRLYIKFLLSIDIDIPAADSETTSDAGNHQLLAPREFTMSEHDESQRHPMYELADLGLNTEQKHKDAKVDFKAGDANITEDNARGQ